MTIAIYFSQPGKMDYPFTDAGYFEAYRYFSEFSKTRHCEVVFVRADSDQGNMKFTGGWRFINDVLVDIDQPIGADIIYVKGLDYYALKPKPNALVINNPGLEKICGNKLKTYDFFSDYMAKTLPINKDNYRDVVSQIKTDLIVVKPVFGSAGKGVIITEKSNFDYGLIDPQYEPYLAQEFIDSSGGVPGLMKGYHDLRIIVFNGVPKLTFLREPRAGLLQANVALGAKLTVIKLDQLPTSALEMARYVDSKLAQYTPRIYAIDLFYQNNKPFIVEINPRPGIAEPGIEGLEFTEQFNTYLLETLLSGINKSS